MVIWGFDLELKFIYLFGPNTTQTIKTYILEKPGFVYNFVVKHVAVIGFPVQQFL